MTKLSQHGMKIHKLVAAYDAHRCSECGGKMFAGDRGFYVCKYCGLEGEVIMEGDVPRLTGETKYHKLHRKEVKHPGRQYADLVSIRILRNTKNLIEKQKTNQPKYIWIHNAILKAIEEENKNGKA